MQDFIFLSICSKNIGLWVIFKTFFVFFTLKFFKNKKKTFRTRPQIDLIFNALKGHCVNIYKVRGGDCVLETLFDQHATASQRFSIISEFYGAEYVMFRVIF